ncbi:hypothetical protein D3C85_1369190 [compost metagenome]
MLTVNFNGQAFNVRVYYSTGTALWWVALSSADKAVTLSHIVLRPDVMLCLEGRIPGYAGALAVGMLRLRDSGVYASIDAFDGGFGLFLSDVGDTVTS